LYDVCASFKARAAVALLSSASPRWVCITARLYTLIVPSIVLAYLAIDYLIAKAEKSIAVVNIVSIVCCLVPTVVFGMAVMGESMTVGKAVGLATILVGSVLLALGGGDDAAEGTAKQDEHHLPAESGSGLSSEGALFRTDSETTDAQISLGKEVMLMGIVLVFYGGPTILFTYGPKVMKSTVSAGLLWAFGGILTTVVSMVMGLAMAGTTLDLAQTLLVALAGILTALGGNGCYTALAQSGMEGTTLAPTVMLYPIVPIVLGVALGEYLSALRSVGLGLLLGAVLVLSREIG
jgi:uncharacterized membrane protein